MEFRGNWKDHLPSVEFTYNNIDQTTMRMAPYEALYGKGIKLQYVGKKIRDMRLIYPELVQITTEKVRVIKERMRQLRIKRKVMQITKGGPLNLKWEIKYS